MDPRSPDLREPLHRLLEEWMPQRRWFVRTEGSASPETSIQDHVLLSIPEGPVTRDGDVEALALLVRSGAGREERTYQVPIVLRRRDEGDEGDALPEDSSVLGTVTAAGSSWTVLDATCDPDGRSALAALLSDPAGGSEGLRLSPISVRPPAPGTITTSRLLDGEQSNTSMILEVEGQDPVILKLFRVLQEGANPDVEVQDALDRAGTSRVAPMVGAVAFERSGSTSGHSMVAQRFLPGVQDAWRVAVEHAVRGEGFTDEARDLGAATAEVHSLLARSLPTAVADDASRAALVQGMLDRLRTVGAVVAQVAHHEAALTLIMRRAESVRWPALQRIHGDYHLGQVLSVPDRGWVLLDFEGEPLRSLAERRAPDVALRDVAGMLRSLDYVSGAASRDHGVDASAWSAAARAAYLEGYVEGSDMTDDEDTRVLLAALEADKAVYEALYEVRHRPDWLGIPLEAIARISGSDGEAG